MKVYNIINTTICEGSFPEVETRVTTDKAKAKEIFKEEKAKAKEYYDKECYEVEENTQKCYCHHDIEDPMYNYYKVELVESEIE